MNTDQMVSFRGSAGGVRRDRGSQARPGIDAAAAARQFVALMDGLQIQWLLSHRRLDMAGILHARLQAQLTVPPAAKPPIG
jgi:transcriptional regulator BetI-like protein